MPKWNRMYKLTLENETLHYILSRNKFNLWKDVMKIELN
jgi:hypothetical protein